MENFLGELNLAIFLTAMGAVATFRVDRFAAVRTRSGRYHIEYLNSVTTSIA